MIVWLSCSVAQLLVDRAVNFMSGCVGETFCSSEVVVVTCDPPEGVPWTQEAISNYENQNPGWTPDCSGSDMKLQRGDAHIGDTDYYFLVCSCGFG